MDIGSYLIPALAIVWIIYRQFVGRFVTTGSSFVLPLVLVVWGLVQTVQADVRWTLLAVAVVAGDLLLTAALGAVRGAAIRLSLREGYLYRRGGALSLVLWAVSIGARVLVGVLVVGTPAGQATAATLTLGFGVSIRAQYLVLAARVRADGRPLRPSGDRRGAGARATLGR
ncbi:hypothetical protein [Pseudonocardia sp.]|jgi:hypothetical protein|uniref:hypothetical protein n=1 Tax=Pseudonocardia sp. TaxID=60912 RepID=UPI002604BD78|nr:hypothetical protein [Pseudonocardia sp.]MCW2720602.1 hypothetical protein [Pseudonocardia sp.]MDT7618694.1 hypothetical protein [Pseudonocardiales bacterium]